MKRYHYEVVLYPKDENEEETRYGFGSYESADTFAELFMQSEESEKAYSEIDIVKVDEMMHYEEVIDTFECWD